LRLSRWIYYLTSLPTLAFGITNWPSVIVALVTRSGPFIVKLRGGLRFKVRTLMDIWIIKETCLDHEYERASVPIQNGWTVIDIGAALGDFTIYAAKKIGHGTVYAYEPSPTSFALLNENIRLNDVQNLHPSQVAVSGHAGTLFLDTSARESVLVRTAPLAPDASRKEVSAITLDQVFEQTGVTQCDFLKIDTEGAEFDILFNASDSTLRNIRHICLEYHDHVTNHTHADLAAFLEQHGFAVTIHPNPAHGYLGLLHAANRA